MYRVLKCIILVLIGVEMKGNINLIVSSVNGFSKFLTFFAPSMSVNSKFSSYFSLNCRNFKLLATTICVHMKKNTMIVLTLLSELKVKVVVNA